MARAQSVEQPKVSLNVERATLVSVIESLREQTSYNFLFNAADLQGAELVTVRLRNVELRTALDSLLPSRGLTYTMEGRTVVIKKETKGLNFIKVGGHVRDGKRQPLPGVTVVLKGTSVGAATNNEGWYELYVPDAGNAVLVFSFIGMETQEVKYTGQDTIDVVLQEDVAEMDEVVVTGYQTLKKRAMAGSVSVVKAEDLTFDGTNTLEQALQGKIPGMMVINRSGLTGTRQRIRVRGTSTLLGNAEPVWVVDGVIQEDPLPFETNDFNLLNQDNMDMIRDFVGSAISWLNPSDIETVTVLKDASSTAIYGVKAANGVIVITTKKGKVGRMSVSYSGNYSISPRLTYDKLELMNSQQRVDVSREAYERNLVLDGNQKIGYSALALAYRNREISLEEFNAGARQLEMNNTDYFDILFRTAFNHSHSISISGGSEVATYRASLGFNSVKNSAIGNEQVSMNGNLNVSARLWKDINLSISLAGSTSKTKGFMGEDPFSYASKMNRAIPCYNEDGTLFYYEKNGYDFNVVNELSQSGNENTLTSVNASLNLRWHIIDGLSFSTQASYSVSNTSGESWYTEQSNYIAQIRHYNYEEYNPGEEAYLASRLPHGGEYNEMTSSTKNWSWRNQLEWTKVFGDVHSVSLMAGWEMRSTINEGYRARTYGYMHDRGKLFVQLPLTFGSSAVKQENDLVKQLPTITDTENNYVSYYVSGSYMYDNRYAINANVRMDASNRFGQDKSTRYLPVWAVGLRWNLGYEPWLQGQDLISDMSFRASYGFQGNVAENISPDLIATITADPKGQGYMLTIDNLPAPELKWEKVQNVNLGVDFSLFKQKVSGSFEWYYKKTTDMIVQQEIPYENGESSRPVNGGEMSNKGWDANFNLTPVRSKDWIVNLGFTFGKVYNNVESTLEPKGTWDEAVSGNLNKEGYPVSSFWAFRFTGLNPEHGGPEFNLSGMERDEAYRDATIYMEHVGKLEPDFTTGLSFSIRYKTLSISSGLYLSLGNQQFMASPMTSYYSIPSEYENMSTEWLDRWRKPGDEKYTNIPSLPDKGSNAVDITLPQGISSLDGSMNIQTVSPYELYAKSNIRVVDAWYLRCNNIAISYTVPTGKLPSFLQNLSLSCNIANPFQIRSNDFKGRDPEVALGQQPLSRNVSIGVSMSF